MKEAELVEFARHITPVKTVCDGDGYRCSAFLTDGTYLPCVVLVSPNPRRQLAIRRFKETRSSLIRRNGLKYREVVASFVTSGNHVNHFDIGRVEPSPYAIPLARLAEIRGETAMSWTEFTVVMDDDRQFFYATEFLEDFFEMPDGYTGERIKKIIPQEIGRPQFFNRPDIMVYRERPFFMCFVDGL